jgi:ADP-heptose:LPS heptosyltransferase
VALHGLSNGDSTAHAPADSSTAEVRPGGAWRGRVLAAVGRINLLQLAAVGERCSVVITADTGPMHIMAAVGAPVVALFGPTSVARTGPVQKPGGAPIRVLDATDLTGLLRAPMDALEVPMVLREARAMLGRKVTALSGNIAPEVVQSNGAPLDPSSDSAVS